ncbi:hypothetical protein GQ55_8G049600 [Panicum hallii var. hallii]|uniref:Uncharacterized protein n=1 Tax=Panicum hallii var. hallii TaxID=1504633 RepID=A0A2T7CKX1_9POAL|nr:hypothetical protein GQ55_8G049600 [Panicum hallii var. hallii]
MAADATPDRSIAAAVASSPKPSPPQLRAASPAEDHRRRRLGIAVPPHVKAAVGSLGGVVEACCLQPADVVKTQLQLDRAAYRGAAHCGTAVARAEGAAALWKGLTPFAYALRQGANASLQSRLRELPPARSPWRRSSPPASAPASLRRSSSSSGAASARARTGAPSTARVVVREEGLRGLWAGAVPTVLRNGANQAAMFTCKSRLDAALWGKRDGDGRALRVSRSMASGFIAAAVGPLCTGPFDVVKSRLMAQGGGNSGGARYRGTAHALRTIYAEEGVRALCKGLLPKLVRIPAYLHSSRRRIFDPLV